MRPSDNIDKMFSQAELKTNSDVDNVVLDDAIRALSQSKQSKPAPRPQIWSKIMKSQAAKGAIAAILIMGVFIGIKLLDGTPAYAIEQTADAISNFNAIYIRGDKLIAPNTKVPFEVWARPNQKRTGSGDYKLVSESLRALCLESKNITYFYDVNENQVTIEKGLKCNINPWVDGNFMLNLKGLASNFSQEYGKDPQTGKKCVFIKATIPQFNKNGQSILLQIDLKTKLPVRGKVWEGLNFSGEPDQDIQAVEYNPQIPDGTFEFKIPDGATVVKK